MRALALILTALSLIAAPAIAAPKPVAKPCKAGTDRVRFDPAKAAGMHRLGDLPPAAQIKTVYRVIDGCPTPVVLRDGIGGNPSAPRPPISGEAQVQRIF